MFGFPNPLPIASEGFVLGGFLMAHFRIAGIQLSFVAMVVTHQTHRLHLKSSIYNNYPNHFTKSSGVLLQSFKVRCVFVVFESRDIASWNPGGFFQRSQ